MSAIGFGDELVRDYLLFRGFLTALKAFDSEIKADKDRGFRPDRIVEHLSSCIINLDLNSLRESWTHLDQRFFARLEHSFLGTAKKLETALLRMYLVTCISSGRQDKLLDFFEKMTPELQGQPEWKDWFALPFIKNADEHPTYAAFFSRQWQDTMLLSLHNFISVVFQSAAMPTLLSYEEELIKLQHLTEENEMLKKKLTALQAGENIDLPKSSRDAEGCGLSTPSELMDDFYVIAQETPPESTGRSIKSLIRNISGGLPTSPVLSRRPTEPRKIEESSGSLKSTKAKPRSPSVPPQSSLSVFESSRSKKDSPETMRSVSHDEGHSIQAKLEKKMKSQPSRSTSVQPAIQSMKEEAMSGFIILSCEKYSEHNSLITHCKFNCSGTAVASSDMDGVIKIWNAIPSISTLSTIMSKTSVLSLDWDRKREPLAGDNHHFQPTCARCSKCGDSFGDSEEMYLQGGAIWHPRCGPSPDGKMDDDYLDDHKANGIIDGHYPPYSPSLSSSRSTSPYSSLTRQYGRTSPGMFLDKDPLITDLSRVYTLSYLTAEPTQGYLRLPIHPHPPKSPQFHRPPDGGSGRRRTPISRPASKQGMQALVDTIQSSTPRPRSPHMNNEEPIELAHYPDAIKPPPDSVPPIERDDFPAPPFPYTDPERRRRWSGSSRDFEDNEEEKQEDPRLKKEEEELSKIATGIGKVFLKNVQEREKLKAWKRANLDPRNASRCPSANKEVPSRLRYYSSIHASPSRDIDRPRPWEDDEFDRSSGYRSSLRSSGNTPCYNVVSSLRPIPKPGYGFSTKSATLPAAGREGGMGFMTSDLAFVKINPTQSSEFGSGKSDLSPTPEQGKIAVNHSASTAFRSTPYSEGFTFRHASYSPHLRRSMPNVNLHMSTEPPKLYPYHLLVTGNYRLPPDIDRCHLERHLSNEEFQAIFHVSRLEFYRLPEWRRNDLKKRAKLF